MTLSAEDNRSGRASPQAPSVSVLPPHVAVLLLTAIAAVLLLAHGSSVYQQAAAVENFPPPVRRQVVFCLLFNGAVAPALVLAWLGELVGAGVLLARRRPAGRLAGRLGVALLPIAVFVAGHVAFNPWLPQVLERLAAQAGGAPAP